jgi:hypothetical protein
MKSSAVTGPEGIELGGQFAFGARVAYGAGDVFGEHQTVSFPGKQALSENPWRAMDSGSLPALSDSLLAGKETLDHVGTWSVTRSNFRTERRICHNPRNIRQLSRSKRTFDPAISVHVTGTSVMR